MLCPVCHSYTDKCEYHPVHCQGEETVCLTEKIWAISGKEKEFELIRRCGRAAECNRIGTYSSDIKTFAINTTCCNSSMCVSPIPTFPSQATAENGLTCPTCYAENAQRCLVDIPLKCVGNENRCIHNIKQELYENRLQIQSFYGCTTDSICRLGSSRKRFLYLTNETFKTETMDMTCSSSVSLNVPFLSYLVFILVGLGTIKLIL
ncbi:hypothetical protein XELAEV_18036252mg [Xenopus laevis]|uniref:UPAR/Ly6 domain-containing protein n=1 Tax=Xenopus laevis TaxID=8355 RepID=A0A974CI00_XENLA|nr:hypothetical protein XELAEV_18036252mg [Xenopus laevis]